MMGKKAKKRRRKARDERDARAVERTVQEVAALVYAAYGFDPNALPTMPDDTPVRAVTKDEAQAVLAEVGLLSQHDFEVLTVAEATTVAVTRLLDADEAGEVPRRDQ
jgi:hypothetical protein